MDNIKNIRTENKKEVRKHLFFYHSKADIS